MFEGFFKRNLNLKVLSIVLAMLLWLVVHYTQHVEESGRGEVSLELPLVVENLPPNLLVVEAPAEVFVTVSGFRKTLDDIKPSYFKAYVDLQGKVGGSYRNLPVHVSSPPDITISSVNPGKVEIDLDEEGQRKVPVTWDMAGAKSTSRVQVKPLEVLVSGSKMHVDRVVAALVEISGSQDSANLLQELIPVPIDALDRPIPGLHVNPPTVKAMIQNSSIMQILPVRPDIVGEGTDSQPIQDISVTPSVLLAEMPKSFKKPVYLSTEPIDITGKSGTFTEKARVLVPDGIKLQDNDQVTVTIKLGKEK